MSTKAGLSLDHRSKILGTLKHDFNNVLTSVKTGLEILAMDDHFEDPENAEDLNDIIKAAQRMALMMDDLLFVFGDLKLCTGKAQDVHPNDIIESTTQQCEHVGMELDVDCGGVEKLSTPPTLVTRALCYALLAKGEFDRTVTKVSLRAGKQGGFGWIIHLQGTITTSFQNGLNNNDSQDRHAIMLQLARQAVLHCQGSISVKGNESQGYLILNFPRI
jgi:K+-sensing histidine kinase KdpD